ncbi:hypothetical protein FPZ54_13000 [Sphingomonas suaedae]|uniref:2OG-Fe(II) oxygenase n=1 Tax=Sphingomonas suaedae TaxID=2599297 RepID=A0A518RHB5_9SPHN|nr:2OG-Fe(II) oxygenase [Sphingomonas suaedae]QDX26832.1 hypothetical protein FPZ54_13000 [Sphingomonas suaedae]
MEWRPYATLDLGERGLLPAGWTDAVAALAARPERKTVIASPAWSFAIVEGDQVRAHLGWLWTLYHGPLRTFAARAVGYPLFANNRLTSAMTLNILSGAGATNEWHRDSNAVTGVFYAHVGEGGGDLAFRDDAGRIARLVPITGLFVCFEGAIDHRVEPLGDAGPRLAIAMVYHRSPIDQPRAFGRDIYMLDG